MHDVAPKSHILHACLRPKNNGDDAVTFWITPKHEQSSLRFMPNTPPNLKSKQYWLFGFWWGVECKTRVKMAHA